uniref:uncharacterized protein LOC124070957 n=1 Tax=Scatophagus argus TaxID=75038 RepID=UPI001ED7DB2C|nr:uncharacterized protein LOC124070957 [Scatophagus argus]
MSECTYQTIGLAILSLALLISMCLNVFFCIRRKAILCKDTDECYNIQGYEGESPSQDEGHYFYNLNDHEQQENPQNHHEQQENPIYGNISTDRRVTVDSCYEMMTMQHTRDHKKSLEPDLNYASLDLKKANKHKKKHRYQQGHAQGRNKQQDQLTVHRTPSLNAFLEVEADLDAQLPSKDTGTMVSHSSIYLNSQQIAQETEDMERQRDVNMERENVSWEGIKGQEDGGGREWTGQQESQKRKDRQEYSNGSLCTQLSEAEAIQSGTGNYSSSFSHDSVQ